MRILYITNGFPYPLTSGYLRHYHFIRELSARHAITLLSIVGPQYERAHLEGIAPYTERVLTFGRTGRRAGRRSLVGRARNAATGDERAHAMARNIARILEHEAFDAAVLSGKRTLPALDALRTLPLVVDVCDTASARVLGQMRQLGPHAIPMHGLKYLRQRHAERALARRANHLVFASHRDRDAFRSEATADSTIVANGVDLEFWKRTGTRLGRNTIVLSGAMHYAPNHDAAMFLIRSIVPRVRAHAPDVQVHVVGRDPAPALLEAGRRAGVEVTGYVDDVRPYLECASVFAAPLRFSSGIQNKLLEAMAFELPVVTTAAAADGLCTGEDVAASLDVADDPESFTARILERLAAAAADPVPCVAARRFVARNFSWQHGAERLEHALETAVAAHSAVEGALRSRAAGRRPLGAGQADRLRARGAKESKPCSAAR